MIGWRRVTATLTTAMLLASATPEATVARQVGLLAPNGGELWRIGSTRIIRWESDGSGRVALFYHVSPFAPWIAIDEDADDDGEFAWTVPDAPTEMARILVVELDTEELDTSDFDFRILPDRGAQAIVGVSTTPTALQSVVHLEPLQPTDVWIVARTRFAPGFEGDGIGFWELSVELPPELVLVDQETLPTSSLDAAQAPETFTVLVDGCAAIGGATVALARVRLLSLQEVTDARVELLPASPSFFVPPAPGWQSCVAPRERLPFSEATGLAVNPTAPQDLRIGRVHPNPTSPPARLKLQLPRSSSVTLRVLDSTGRTVRTLDLGTRGPGDLDVEWDGRDARGVAVAAGVYVLELRAAGESARTRVTLLPHGR